ncbi:MAG: hypothetical protein QNJ32_26785 [Xenococcaceae cyanobacterium MO_167.B27]|nr:hypothetical protein [Xenococcaceae cyanobacterium MO_167.B27]
MASKPLFYLLPDELLPFALSSTQSLMTFEKRYYSPFLKLSCHSGITRLIRLGYDPATVAALAGTSTEMICNNYLAAHNEIDIPIMM